MMMLFHWLVIPLCSVSQNDVSSLLMIDVNNSLFKYLVLFMHQMHLYICILMHQMIVQQHHFLLLRFVPLKMLDI